MKKKAEKKKTAKTEVQPKPQPDVTTPAEIAKPWSLDRAHEWTHTGDEVLILKCVDKDGTSHGGFKWPLTVGIAVEAPDWNARNSCGGGLHGWPWGLGIGNGKRPDWFGTWIVFGIKPADPVVGNLEGSRKCKVKSAVIRFVGGWRDATKFVLSGQMALVFESSKENRTSDYYSSAATSGDSSSAATSGDSSSAATSGNSSSAATSGYYSSAATSGYSSSAATSGNYSSAATSGDSSSAATSGYYSSAATSGNYSSAATSGNSSSAATSGYYSSAATSGYYSSAATSGNYSSAATSGDYSSANAKGIASSAVACGLGCKVSCGPFGIIATSFRNGDRIEMRCAEVGCGDGSDGKLKAHVWYKLDADGKFIES